MHFSVRSVVHLATPTPVVSMLQHKFTKVRNMKNLHIEHPEDTILTGDLSVLKAFESENHYSVKIDGSPAIVWGTNPENGKFFVVQNPCSIREHQRLTTPQRTYVTTIKTLVCSRS